MTELELKHLLSINKPNLTRGEFKELYCLDLVNTLKVSEILPNDNDLIILHLMSFASRYHIPYDVVYELSLINDSKSLFMTYFYYRALSKDRELSLNFVHKLCGVRYTKSNELQEISRLVYEFVDPKLDLEDVLKILSLEAQELFEDALVMEEDNQAFVMDALKEFCLNKETLISFDKSLDLPFNNWFGQKLASKEKGLVRKKEKSVLKAITVLFNHRNKS